MSCEDGKALDPPEACGCNWRACPHSDPCGRPATCHGCSTPVCDRCCESSPKFGDWDGVDIEADRRDVIRRLEEVRDAAANQVASAPVEPIFHQPTTERCLGCWAQYPSDTRHVCEPKEPASKLAFHVEDYGDVERQLGDAIRESLNGDATVETRLGRIRVGFPLQPNEQRCWECWRRYPKGTEHQCGGEEP